MSEGSSGQKFRVITVHGVNSKGEWQEEVAKALGLFFNFEPIKYNHYRWFFGTELVLCPFVWLPLGTLLARCHSRGLGPWRSWNLSLDSGYFSARGLGSFSISPLGSEEIPRKA